MPTHALGNALFGTTNSSLCTPICQKDAATPSATTASSVLEALVGLSSANSININNSNILPSSLNLGNSLTNNGNTIQLQSAQSNNNHYFQFPPQAANLQLAPAAANASAAAAINSNSLAMLHLAILNSPNGLAQSPFFNMSLNASAQSKCLNAASLNLLTLNSLHGGLGFAHNMSALNRSPDPDPLNTPRIFRDVSIENHFTSLTKKC